MPRKTNKSEYVFLRIRVNPATPHESLVLKELENCLNQCFGTTRARTNVDVLWCGEGGGEYVLRVANEDAMYVKAATVVSSKAFRLNIVAESESSVEGVLPEGVDKASLRNALDEDDD